MPTPSQFPPDNVPVTATILDTASLSDGVNIGGVEPVNIQVPATIDGSQFTFQVSNDDSTYVNLYDEAGNEIAVQFGASRGVRLDPNDFRGWTYMKVRTGTAASPSVQAQDVALTVNCEQV